MKSCPPEDKAHDLALDNALVQSYQQGQKARATAAVFQVNVGVIWRSASCPSKSS